jgi:hypothetical protein
MKHIIGTKLVTLEQVMFAGEPYVKILDIIDYFEDALEKAKISKKPHVIGKRMILEQTVKNMKALEYGYECGSTTINIPNDALENYKKKV